MTSYSFRLYRRRQVTETRTVITTLTIWKECHDPFVERLRLARKYPGFGITIGKSSVDQIYDDMFD